MTEPRYFPGVREYDTPSGRLAYVAQVWDRYRPDDYRPDDQCDHVHRSHASATTCAAKLAKSYR